jgi:hypothetical protein
VLCRRSQYYWQLLHNRMRNIKIKMLENAHAWWNRYVKIICPYYFLRYLQRLRRMWSKLTLCRKHFRRFWWEKGRFEYISRRTRSWRIFLSRVFSGSSPGFEDTQWVSRCGFLSHRETVTLHPSSAIQHYPARLAEHKQCNPLLVSHKTFFMPERST